MFKSILRFVGIIAFTGVFTSSAFAVNCTDPSSGSTRAATSTEYVGPTGKCQPCGEPYYGAKFNSSYVISSCGNGTLVCKNSGYKMIYDVDYYVCFNCPHASNGKKLGLPTSYNQFNYYSWSSSSRCMITKFGEPGTNGTVKKTYKPTQQCVTWRVLTYETTPDYDRDIMDDADINCPWEEVSSVYDNCDAGYHLSGTGAGNSCVICSAGTYYGGGEATSCHECPWDAMMPTGKVTSPEGSTSASQCYFPGSSSGSHTDTSGTYIYGGNCFLDDVSTETFLMHFLFDSCNDWSVLFDGACGTHCGPVVQGWDQCKNACIYGIYNICSMSSDHHSMMCTLSNANGAAETRQFYLDVMNHLPASPNCYTYDISIMPD